MMRTLRHSLHLAKIALTLARHDALFALQSLQLPKPALLILRILRRRSDASSGERLSQALQRLGPSFIKLGQALSTRPDLVGEAIAKDLAQLQDNMPVIAGDYARRTIESQLNAPLDTLYTSFEETPIAAASIAQVHFAVTVEGKHVAVKILRPDIEQRFTRDVELFQWIAEIVERRIPRSRRLKPVEMIRTFAETVRIELDLRMEAAAAEELKANSADDPDFYVPAIDWPRTARRVLTLERIDGIRISDLDAIREAGIDLNATMEKAAKAFFNQVFRDGFFHADMHPGNLFVLRDGRLAPVDFGIMGRINRTDQLALARILYAFLQGDYMTVATVHREVGWIPPHVSVENFAQAARAVGAPIFGRALNEISVGSLLGQLLAMSSNFEMIAQPQLFLLQKTMITAEGVGRMLNPNINMWKLSEPLIKQWAEANFSRRARLKQLASELPELIQDAPRVLRSFREFIERTNETGFPISSPAMETADNHRRREHRSLLRLGWVIVALLVLNVIVMKVG
jgi:ubiquinone biosynthesis protein